MFKRTRELEEEVQSLKDRVWELENPCKYKLGDKFEDGNVIISTEIKPPEFRYVSLFGWELISERYWEVTTWNSKLKKQETHNVQ